LVRAGIGIQGGRQRLLPEQRRAVQWLPLSLVPSAGFDRHLRRHRNFIGETLSSLS
jgi:hypothetical protein